MKMKIIINIYVNYTVLQARSTECSTRRAESRLKAGNRDERYNSDLNDYSTHATQRNAQVNRAAEAEAELKSQYRIDSNTTRLEPSRGTKSSEESTQRSFEEPNEQIDWKETEKAEEIGAIRRTISAGSGSGSDSALKPSETQGARRGHQRSAQRMG